MYYVSYVPADEIIKQYRVIGTLNSECEFQECLLIDGRNPIAIVLNKDIILSNATKEPLQDLVRCYIMKQESLLGLIPISEIIDRYR